MKLTGKLKIAMMAIAILLSCGTAHAHRWHSRPCRVVTIVTKPDITVRVGNRFTQKERFRMAMAYLKGHDYLTVTRYAKMTELSEAAAKAELDAFAADKYRPIEVVIKNGKRMYLLKNR